MADRAAPTGRKVGGQVRAGSRAGNPTGSRGGRRQALPLKGGHPSGPHAHLVAGNHLPGGAH